MHLALGVLGYTLMWPFFTFYGGKWRTAPRYPRPCFARIVEPFAGAAGYSVRYAEHDVVLVEKDATIAALWRYLINAREREILALPLIEMEQTVNDLDVCDEARSLIGFWLNKGTAAPCKRPGAWMRQRIRPKSFWGAEIRERIASQVARISHWTVIHGDFTDAFNFEATWFVDPPYALAGKHYRHGAREIDYGLLGDWCRHLHGQAIVCENDGADWLPFRPFLSAKSLEGKHGHAQSREAIWTNL